MSLAEPLPALGHNNPPSEQENFERQFKEKYPELFMFAERLLASEGRIPDTINDDENSGKLGDFIKQLKTANKNLDAARSSEKEFYLEGGRKVDGFFKRYMEKLQSLKERAEKINGFYLKQKEDEKRRQAEEEAARLKAEAEEKIAEAQRREKEAEEKRKEAEAERQRIQEEAERKQREIEAAAEAERKRQQAEIDAQKKALEDAVRKVREAREQKERDDAALEQAKKEAAEAKQGHKDAESRAKEIEREAREQKKELKTEVRAAESVVASLEKSAKLDVRESRKLLDEAIRTDKQAERMDNIAEASAANLVRVRGEQSLSTARTEWVGTVVDRSALDKAALWPHLKAEDLQHALNAWVRANPGQRMPGAYIREETKAVTL